MKKLVPLLMMIISIASFSCKKGDDASPSLTGSWELKKTIGGMLGNQTYATGNGNIMKFTDTDFEIYNNGALAQSGKYTLIKESKPINNTSSDHKLVYNGTSSLYLKISGRELTVFYGIIAADGVEAIYQKK